MTPGLRILSFALIVAAVFYGALLLGRAIDPETVEDDHGAHRGAFILEITV